MKMKLKVDSYHYGIFSQKTELVYYITNPNKESEYYEN